MTAPSTPPFDWIALTGAKPKGKRPYFFEDPAVERVLAILMAVTQELAVTRERLDTVERLLEKSGHLDRAQIEAYAPEPEAATARAQATRAYIARVMRIVQQEMEAINKPEHEYDLAAKADELRKE
jgi:biopolymer transport protein ExbB/TolQ